MGQQLPVSLLVELLELGMQGVAWLVGYGMACSMLRGCTLPRSTSPVSDRHPGSKEGGI